MAECDWPRFLWIIPDDNLWLHVSLPLFDDLSMINGEGVDDGASDDSFHDIDDGDGYCNVGDNGDGSGGVMMLELMVMLIVMMMMMDICGKADMSVASLW